MMRWLLGWLFVGFAGAVIAASTLLWWDATVNDQACSVAVQVRGPWAVQVFARDGAVSATVFTHRYFPQRGPTMWLGRASEQSETAGLWQQREVAPSPTPGSWGWRFGRFALAGGWGDAAGRHNRVGLRLPLWCIAGLSAMLGGWMCRRMFRGRRRAAAGACAQCGYDLRGSAGACPECGHATLSQ